MMEKQARNIHPRNAKIIGISCSWASTTAQADDIILSSQWKHRNNDSRNKFKDGQEISWEYQTSRVNGFEAIQNNDFCLFHCHR